MDDSTNASVPKVNPQSDNGNNDKSGNNKGKDGGKKDGKDKGDSKKDKGSGLADKAKNAGSDAAGKLAGFIKGDDIDSEAKKEEEKHMGEEEKRVREQNEQEEIERKQNQNSPAKQLGKQAAKAVAMQGGKFALINALILMLKSLLMNMIGAVVNIINGIWQTIMGVLTTIANVIGVSAFIAGCIMTGGVLLVGVAVYSVYSSNDIATKDSPAVETVVQLDCDFENNSFTSDSNPNIDTDAITTEHAKKIYSFAKTYGLTDDMVAGMLGNWSVESGIDPTGVEGVYDTSEKYSVSGPEKKSALADFDSYTRNHLFTMYANNGKSINHSAYQAVSSAGGDDKYYGGIGLGQFTGPAAYKLMRFADGAKKDWWNLDLQLAFVITDDGYRPGWFKKWIESGESAGNARDAASYFLANWEGCAATEDNAVSARMVAASKWRMEFASWTVDTAYANSIINMAGTVSVEGTKNAENKQRSKCGDSLSGSASSISNEIIAAPIAPGTMQDRYNTSMTELDYKAYLSKKLSEIIGDDGNVKPEYSGGVAGPGYNITLAEEHDKWKGQCVAWSKARIESYVKEKYQQDVSIGRFGNGGDPYTDGDCLGALPAGTGESVILANVKTYPNFVFSYLIDGNEYGHTGYVEYICADGGIIISECNLKNTGDFYLRYIAPGNYKNYMFFSTDDIYKANEGTTAWNRRHTG